MLKKIGSSDNLGVYNEVWGFPEKFPPGGVSNEKYGNSYESSEVPIKIWGFPMKSLNENLGVLNKKLRIFHRMSEGLQWYSEIDNFFQIQNWNCC